MTVSNNTTRQIFTCNGVTTARTANFRVIDESQLRVVLYTIATGVTTDLTGSGTDYTVTSAGGATTDFTTTVAYSSAYKIIALLDMPLSQETDYVANDSFPAESHEAALDKLTLIAQQQADILSRCATLPEFAATNLTVILPTPTDGYALVWDGVTGTIRNSTVSIATLETEAAALYAIAADISTVAGISANVTSVAGNSANINTVAGIAAAVSTVAGISGAVSAVSANSANINTVAGISANVTTVAGISANVITVAGISADVTTLAGLSTQITGVYNIRTDVTTVAGISANVTTVAGISANVTTVAGITANLATVAGISANVTTVAGISTAVSTVSTNIADVNTCATNIAAIIAAPAAATAAAASAAAAAAAAAGISMKSSCRVATTAALTVTYANGTLGVGATLTNAGVQAAISLDGVSLSVNDRVLVKDQASALQNGIYFVTVVGTGATNWVLTRATDYDQAAEIVEGTATIISEGTVNASHIFVMTHNGTITVGTTAIDWTALTANATTANTLTTPRAIYGNNFDGSAALTQVIASTYGGTGNGFAKISGPASTEKTFTLPNASATILTDNALVTAAQGGTGNGFTKFSGPTTSERTKTLRDASDTILELGGSYTPTGTFTNMILATPNLGTPSAGTLTNCTGLPIAGGGTGGTTAATARSALGMGVLSYPLMDLGGLNFNGTTTYLDTNPLTGIADGKKGTLFAVLRFANAASATERIVSNTGTTFDIIRTSTGVIQITGKNSGASGILDIRSATAVASAAGTYYILASWDLSTAGSGRIYVNDASTYSEVTYTNDTLDYTVAEWSVGATVAGANFFSGDFYTLWFDAVNYLDISVEANRRKFVDANVVAVFLGQTGLLPTGSAPTLFLAYNGSSNWPVDRVGTVSTAFTINGAAANVTTGLNGQFGQVAAQQANMESASNRNQFVSPAFQHSHPGHPKCWGRLAGDGSGITASYNLTSVTDTGTGVIGVTIGTDFSGATVYSANVSAELTGTTYAVASDRKTYIRNGTLAAGTVSLDCIDSTATTNLVKDPQSWHFVAFGDQ